MRLPSRPREITEMEWEMLTSPENYYADGELSHAEADKMFRQRVSQLVASRRATSASVQKKPHSTTSFSRQMRAMCCHRAGGGRRCQRIVVVPVGTQYPRCWQHRGRSAR